MATVTKIGERSTVRYLVEAGDVRAWVNPRLSPWHNLEIEIAGNQVSPGLVNGPLAPPRYADVWGKLRTKMPVAEWAQEFVAPFVDKLVADKSPERHVLIEENMKFALTSAANLMKRANEQKAIAAKLGALL